MFRIALHSNAEAPVVWLEEFFGPSWTAGACRPHASSLDAAPTPVVSLTISPDRYRRMLATPGDPGKRSMDVFALDGSFERLLVWRDASGELLLYDARAEAFLSIEAGHAAVHLVAERDHRHVRVLLMRVVREVEMLGAIHRGALFLHGAAAVWRGRTVVIAGEKRSGKTTMLLGLLSGREAPYLANDRVLVDLSGASPIVAGLQTIAKVRADSLQYLPALRPPVFDPPHRHYLTIEECARGSSLLEPTRHEYPPMSPAELCRWLGVERVATAPHGMFVLPRVDPGVERFVVRELGEAEAADRIRASVFSAGPVGIVSEAFGRGWNGRAPGPDETIDLCRRLARAGPTWECRLGPRAFHPPDVWGAITAH